MRADAVPFRYTEVFAAVLSVCHVRGWVDRARQVLPSKGIAAEFVFGLLLILAAGCTEEGTYRLHLTFADDALWESVKQVELFAVEPGMNTCEEWLQGELSLENLNVYSRLVVELPGQEEHRLSRVPARVYGGECAFGGGGRGDGGA